jgi:hypothetical protein
MKALIRCFALALLSVMLCGCSLFNDEPKEKSFNQIYSGVSMNKEMKIREVTQGVSLDDISRNTKFFSIENTTNSIISSPHNYNEKLMIYNSDKNQWDYVENTAKSMNNDDIQIEHTNDQGPAYTLAVVPDLSGYSQQ